MGIYPILNVSPAITLFAPRPPSRTGPSSFMLSAVVHGVVFGLIFIAFSQAAEIEEPHPEQRYTVRILKLHETAQQIHWSPGSGIAHPTQPALSRANQVGGRPTEAAQQQLAQRTPATVTLVQPDVPLNTSIPQTTPIPTVVILSPEHIPTVKIVPPPRQEAAAVDARPSLSAPNREWNVADVNLSSSAFVTETIPIPASTTSPIAIPGLQLVKIPEITSNPAGQPMPATVVSISDVVLPEGTIALPFANQTAPGSISDSLMLGRPNSTSDSGNGSAAGGQNGSGPGPIPGSPATLEIVAKGSAGKNSAATGSNYGSDAGSPSGNEPAVDRITRPKDGNFGVVVVGSSLAEEYPEILGMWADRLAYTVYLHVGLNKSWILQYSLPRALEAAGNTTRPNAPWPYLMVRPHAAFADSDTDAIIVHGFVNTEGRFEQLAVVFPPQFPQTKVVLDALQQWQFRPAAQNGRSTAVEVLLIIPEESE